PPIGRRYDDDVAACGSRCAVKRVEMSERRRAVEQRIADASAHLFGKQGIATRRVDDDFGSDLGCFRLAGKAHAYTARPLSVFAEKHFLDARPFKHLRARFASVVEEQLVEVGPLDLERARMVVVDSVYELHGSYVIGSLMIEACAKLHLHPGAAQLVEHAHALKERNVPRQQRLADVKARKSFALEEDDTMPLPRKERCEGGAGWAAATDDGIDLVG
ncbi:MAG: hypothetical protein ABI552_11815, partial [Casimicrobiaceae bacterium]